MSRLAAVGRRFGVPDAGIDALRRILELQATDPTASTTVRAFDEAVDRHVADSLVALELPEVRAARQIADVGSGAGWPGLALAAALPEASVALVESVSRHCRYLERAVEVGGFANVRVVHARAEEWRDGIGTRDLVTARALAALPVLCEYAAPLLVDGGVLVAWKGAVEPAEAAAAATAAATLGLEVGEVRRVEPYAAAERRTLHVFRKIAPTPERFPRRPGGEAGMPTGPGSPRGRVISSRRIRPRSASAGAPWRIHGAYRRNRARDRRDRRPRRLPTQPPFARAPRHRRGVRPLVSPGIPRETRPAPVSPGRRT